MKLSLCLTNYNRTRLLFNSFVQVIEDRRITEIIIVDDASTDPNVEKFYATLRDNQKIKVRRNESNLGMARNKAKAISLASNSHAIIFDSDNVLTPAYLDALEKVFGHGLPNFIYMPAGAMPNFDYTQYANMIITRDNAKRHLHERMFDCLLNTCNYVVPTKQYGQAFEFNPEVKGSDTIWFNYLWLKAGNPFLVVPDMYYSHLVHDGSGWKADASHNIKMANQTKELIKKL